MPPGGNPPGPPPDQSDIYGDSSGGADGTEGAAFYGEVAQFTTEYPHQASDFAVSVTWPPNDGPGGTPTVIPNGPGGKSFAVLDSHPPFAEEESSYLTVTVSDSYGTTTWDSYLDVHDARLTVTSVEPPNAVEGQPFPGPDGNDVVATFTDANPYGTIDDFMATIMWGDNTDSHGVDVTITQDRDTHVFSVHGRHTYDEELTGGTLSVEVEDHYETASGGTSVTVADAPLVDTTIVPSIEPLHGTEGVPLGSDANPPVVATFTDADFTETAADFQATIFWGDGHSQAGIITGSDGSFAVAGNYTYAEQGVYPLEVTLTAPRGRGFDVHSTAQIDDPALNASPAREIDAMPGEPLNDVVLASFTDPHVLDEPSGDYTATIEWGDGSTDAGTVGGGNGQFEVTGSHTYDQAGQYTARVLIRDDDQSGTGTSLAVTTTAITVGPPDGPLQAEGRRFSAVEQEAANDVVVATFTDNSLPPGCHVPGGTIHWGDGTSDPGVLVDRGSGTFEVHGSHTYQESGSYLVTFEIQDPQGTEDTSSSTATVADADLTGTAASLTLQADTNLLGTSVASFYDPNREDRATSYQARIYWGDGMSDLGTVTGTGGNYDVIAPLHVYANPGAFETLVVIKDINNPQEDYSTLVVSGTMTVTRNIEGAVAVLPMATFRDLDPEGAPGDYTGTVTWDDGSSATATITGGGGNDFGITGYSPNHTWSEEGKFPVGIEVMDAGGSTVALPVSVPVADAGLHVETRPNIQAMVNVPPSAPWTVATFRDDDALGKPADYHATISWGDGLVTEGTIPDDGTGQPFRVEGEHTYTRTGVYQVAVFIMDVGGSEVVAQGTATVTADTSATTEATALFRTNDPEQADLLSLGEASVALNTGGLRLSQPLDFDLSPGTSLGGDPALVYNSNTVHVHPIINATLTLGGDLQEMPEYVDAQLTWNHGTAQQPVRFYLPTDPQPESGDQYLVSLSEMIAAFSL